jgi:hypothetical protein
VPSLSKRSNTGSRLGIDRQVQSRRRWAVCIRASHTHWGQERIYPAGTC